MTPIEIVPDYEYYIFRIYAWSKEFKDWYSFLGGIEDIGRIVVRDVFEEHASDQD